MRSRSTIKATVSIGDGVVVINNPNRSDLSVANLLGQDNDADNVAQVLYLDRMIHGYGISFSGWEASGAISTILTRN